VVVGVAVLWVGQVWFGGLVWFEFLNSTVIGLNTIEQ
jgi:hypothetical protein